MNLLHAPLAGVKEAIYSQDRVHGVEDSRVVGSAEDVRAQERLGKLMKKVVPKEWCPDCKGSGSKISTKMAWVGGKQKLVTKYRPCPTCSGVGRK